MSSSENSARPRSQAEQLYRRQVEQLVEACLTRIRRYELPDEAEPPAAQWPSND
jgi:hypothetical protein